MAQKFKIFSIVTRIDGTDKWRVVAWSDAMATAYRLQKEANGRNHVSNLRGKR